MIKVLVQRTVATTIGVLLSIILDYGAEAYAAEIKVLSANGVRAILVELAGKFESAAGNKITIEFGEAGEIKKRIQDGEVFDMSILPLPVFEDLIKQQKIVAGTTVGVARTTFGMGVRTGDPKPDVSSADALKRSLLATKSIVITDPATGGVTGVHFQSVVERLGIADEIKSKLRLNKGSYNAEFVAKGEADLAVQGDHEIRCVPGITFVAYPVEFQRSVTFSAGVATTAKEPGLAKTFIQFLSGPNATTVLKAKCMEAG